MPVDIDTIVRKLVSDYQPERIILFGSHARGDAGPDSDVDLLIVKDTPERPLDRMLTARRALGRANVPLDVFVLTPEEFAETKDVIGGIAYAPAKYGQVLYEKP